MKRQPNTIRPSWRATSNYITFKVVGNGRWTPPSEKIASIKYDLESRAAQLPTDPQGGKLMTGWPAFGPLRRSKLENASAVARGADVEPPQRAKLRHAQSP